MDGIKILHGFLQPSFKTFAVCSASRDILLSPYLLELGSHLDPGLLQSLGPGLDGLLLGI